jgi:hypothetical protein
VISTRAVAWSAWVLALMLASTGCGGGGASNAPPASAPPPAGAPASAGSTGNSAASLNTGYRYRFNMIAPPNDNNAITEREVYLYFWPDTSRVWLRLENRLGTPIKILWDQSRFTDADGRVFRTVHEGITYQRRNDPQDYTEVFALQRHHDWLAPVDLLEDPTAQQGGGMRLLFPTDGSAVGFLGRSFGASLVLEIEGRARTYNLLFKVESVIPPG